MRLPKMTLNPKMMSADSAVLRMTPMERLHGRFMRAPDHGADDGVVADPSPVDAAVDAVVVDADAVTTPADQETADEGTVLGGGAEGEEGKAEAGKEGAEDGKADAPSGPPDAYDLKAPEGMQFDAEAFAAAEPVLRELNLDNAAAQQLVSNFGEQVLPVITQKVQQQVEGAIIQRAVTQRKEWADAFESDPDLGGANKVRTENDVARAFDHYGLKKGEGVRQFLDESGLGNQPDLIRFVARVGRDLEEGGFERGDVVSQPKSPEGRLYGAEFQPK